MTDSDLLFADEDSSPTHEFQLKPWKIAIIDDDQDVHHVSKLAMKRIEYLAAALNLSMLILHRKAFN